MRPFSAGHLHACLHGVQECNRAIQNATSASASRAPALADDDIVALVAAEAGGDVGGDVGVALLVPLVLLDEVQVVAAHHNRAVHLGALHLQRTAAGEGTGASGL